MIKEAVAKIYAQALFNVARKNKRVEDWGRKLALVEEIIGESGNLRIFFLTPGVNAVEKMRVIKKLSQLGKLSEELTNFFKLLIKRRKLSILPAVVREYRVLLDFFLGEMDVLIRSAVELSQTEKEDMNKVLEANLRKRTRIKYEIEPDLIGGVVVRAGEKIYDGSLLGQLDMMRKRMLEG